MLGINKISLKRRTGSRLVACILLLATLTVSVIARNGNIRYASPYLASASVPGDNARTLVLTENFDNAISVYAELILRDSTNVVLSAEYAYALALDGIYDAALIRLDKIRNLQPANQDVNFYASQILSLMGYDQLSGEFLRTQGNSSAPSWIASKAPVLLQKYKRIPKEPGTLTGDELVTKFTRANRLTAQNCTFQSIALFEEITYQYPSVYLPYLGYSAALEKAGMYDKAAETIQKALTLVGSTPEDQEAKQVLEKRLAALQSKTGTSKSGSKTVTTPNTEIMKPQMMAYGGGTFSSDYTNFNARVGVFVSKSDYTAFDIGLYNSGSSTYTNLGLSIYNRQKIFVAGFGLTSTLGGGSSIFYGKVSVGLSIMNKKGTTSLDIFLDGKMPLSKGQPTVMGLSIGESVYFGKRKK
jgi:tetratricopeptide (TPR) repeat protein